MAKTISKEIVRVQQDVLYTETVTALDFKLKIEISSNAYDFQSYARISVFSKESLQWNVVASIQGPAMKTPHGLYAQRADGTQERHFVADRKELIRQAGNILDVSLA